MFQGLFKKATGGFIAIIAAAGQLANRLNLFVLDLCIRDRVTQFCAVCQHDRRRAMDIIIFLAETTFCKYRRAPLAAVEQVYEVVHIKTSLTSEVQHYFLLADIPAFGEETSTDEEIELSTRILTLLKSTPGCLKSGERGGRPIRTGERLKSSFWFLQGCQPNFQFQLFPIG